MADRILRNTDAPAKIALALLIAGSLTLGCTGTQLAFKYMSSCPAEGPETSSDLGLLPIPVNLEDFYADVMARGDAFAISELGAVRHRETRRPILSIRHQGRSAERSMPKHIFEFPMNGRSPFSQLGMVSCCIPSEWFGLLGDMRRRWLHP